MLWPSIFLLILLGLVIATSIPGLTQASKLSDSIQTMECGVGLVMDDLLNGNITTDQTSFFSGTNTLVTLLRSLNNTIDDISNNFTAVKTSVDNVQSTANTIRGNIETLGLGGANSSFSLTYTDPTPASSSYTALSGFSSILGTPTTSDTLSYIMYAIIDALYSAMGTLSTNINNIDTVTGNGDLKSQITQGVDSFSPINDQIDALDDTIYEMFGVVGPILGYIRLAVLIFFSVALGLGTLVVIGVVFMTFCDKPKCRYLMYIPCILITIIVVLGFLIAVILSIMAPVLYMGCTVLNTGLDTQQGFVNLTGNLGLNGNNITSLVSVCLPGGDGKILEALGLSQLDSLNDNLGDISSIMSGFN